MDGKVKVTGLIRIKRATLKDLSPFMRQEIQAKANDLLVSWGYVPKKTEIITNFSGEIPSDSIIMVLDNNLNPVLKY